MVFPKETYTSWITRVAAYFIDLLPVAGLTAIGQVLLFATADNEYHRTARGVAGTTTPNVLGTVLALMFGLAALAFAIWNYGYRQGATGSSIGKSVMKFKVVAETTGRPIGFGLSILRQLAHILDSLFCSTGYL